MSNLNIDDIRKAIDLIEKLPKPEVIEAILITRLLPGIYRSKYKGKNYFLIGKHKWEQEVKPQLEEMKTSDYSAITTGYIGVITGTPVIEDDELVKMIILKWTEHFSGNVLSARKPPEGWQP